MMTDNWFHLESSALIDTRFNPRFREMQTLYTCEEGGDDAPIWHALTDRKVAALKAREKAAWAELIAVLETKEVNNS